MQAKVLAALRTSGSGFRIVGCLNCDGTSHKYQLILAGNNAAKSTLSSFLVL